MYCADQIHRMLIPSCLNKWLRDTFRLGERGRDDMAPRDTMTCLPYSMRHVLANISIAQEPGGGSHRIHRRLRRSVAYAAVYLSIRTCCILNVRWVVLEKICITAALIGTGHLGWAGCTVSRYAGTSHHSTRAREGKGHPWCAWLPYVARFGCGQGLSWEGTHSVALGRAAPFFFSNQAGG